MQYYIYRYNPISTPTRRVSVMVIASAVSAAAHRHHPLRLWHQVVGLAQNRRHLVGDSPGHDNHVRLARRTSEDHAETVHVVSGKSAQLNQISLTKKTNCFIWTSLPHCYQQLQTMQGRINSCQKKRRRNEARRE